MHAYSPLSDTGSAFDILSVPFPEILYLSLSLMICPMFRQAR